MTISKNLDQITDFPGLIHYLRDELEWEIPDDAAFKELTFSWTPSEVGLDLNEPIEITQLRPLRADQPWGIFFLNFPHAKLPVTVMRRILRGLSKRQRASANAGDKAAWNKDDLLFISAVGEADDRRLSFAHFQDRGNDLPALRVIGWDHDDTVRRLSHVDQLLHEKLAWPNRGVLAEAWRDQWRSAFTERPRESVRTAKAMAEALAAMARDIRDRIRLILPKEKPGGDLRNLFEAVKETLSKDLDTDKFADTYAQTIAYGLLSARINQVRERDAKHEQAQPAQLGSKPELPQITADAAGKAMPTTNPFLRELFGSFLSAGGRDGEGSGLDFDELGVGEVVDLLNAADMEAVLLDFDKQKAGDDPVIHFYEGFLHAYDKALKVQRGVFYTPRPVVSFIVRSVDEALRTEFGLEDGLADTATWAEFVASHPEVKIPDGVMGDEPFVKILDPATGTGTFLVEVIELIHDRLVAKWKRAGLNDKARLEAWNAWVPQHLLPRLYGFELMMAPYAVAHMKIGLKLAETGYDFAGQGLGGEPARARVFLTNALEPAFDIADRFDFAIPALAHEAVGASEAKSQANFSVVLGNPPYSNFGQTNRIPSILSALQKYKYGLNERKLNLDDDFIKFLRFSHEHVVKNGLGVIGIISNNVFIDGITHRRMRECLVDDFNRIEIIDLHGSTKKREISPDGTPDENVFDIQQGVSITLLSRAPSLDRFQLHADLWGTRADKFKALQSDAVDTMAIHPVAPNFFFIPKTGKYQDDWERWPAITTLMPLNSTGVKTHLDDVFVGFSSTEVEAAIGTFLMESWRDVPLSECPRSSAVRKAVLLKTASQTAGNMGLRSYAYRPFDTRIATYLPAAIDAGDHRFPVMKHIISGSSGLVVPRQLSRGTFAHAFVTAEVTDMCLLSTATKECGYIFPFTLSDGDSLVSSSANISGAASRALNKLGGVDADLAPFIYAILHSPIYRTSYVEHLISGFARIPLPKDGALLADLVPRGIELIALHLLDSAAAAVLADPKVRFVNPGNVEARLDGRKIDARRNPAGRVYLNDGCWFETVPESVWNHSIGGYLPAQKWLKDRAETGGAKAKPGRILTSEDQLHYRRMVVALARTAELMSEIDEVIARHGGWPDAFRGMVDG